MIKCYYFRQTKTYSYTEHNHSFSWVRLSSFDSDSITLDINTKFVEDENLLRITLLKEFEEKQFENF